MKRMRWVRHAVIAASVAVAITGCATVPGGPSAPREVAVVVDDMTCTDPLVDPPAVQAGLVPDDFTPVAVLHCVPFAQREDDRGVVAGTEIVRHEGDLTAFLAAMAAPSDPEPAPDTACPLVMHAVQQIWAVDAAGGYVLMSFPSTTCWAPKDEVPLAELAKLEVVERTFIEGQLIESRAAIEAGCPTRASVAPLQIAGGLLPEEQGALPEELALQLREDGAIAGSSVAPAPAPSDGGPTAEPGVLAVPWQPPALTPIDEITGATVCEYAQGEPPADGSPVMIGDSGEFAGVRAMDAEAARAVVEAATSAPRIDAECAVTASRFVVVHVEPRDEPEESTSDLPTDPLDPALTESVTVLTLPVPAITVELDGCTRIVGPDALARSAPPALIALLTP